MFLNKKKQKTDSYIYSGKLNPAQHGIIHSKLLQTHVSRTAGKCLPTFEKRKTFSPETYYVNGK